MRRSQAFTLIELLIVIAIIAILATVLVPYVFLARLRAQDSAARSYARQVVTAIENYMAAAPVNTLGDVIANTLNGTTSGAGTAGQASGECRTIDALNQGGAFEGELTAAAYPTAVTSCIIYADGAGGYAVAARAATTTWWGLYAGQISNQGQGATPADTDPSNGGW